MTLACFGAKQAAAQIIRYDLPQYDLVNECGDDTVKLVPTWMDGRYEGDEDKTVIDTDVFVENAKQLGAYCGKNPTMSIVNAAEEVLGK